MKKINLLILVVMFVLVGCGEQSSHYIYSETTADLDIEKNTIIDATYDENENSDTQLKLGDYIEMGNYLGENILWRCVSFEKIKGYDKNGNPVMDATDTATEYKEGYLPLMLSDKILCFKAFDAFGDNTVGSHGRGYKEFRQISDINNIIRSRSGGSNYWGDSNIRDWLNSDKDSGNVIWSCGNPPDREHVVSDEYSDESGFLTNFNSQEKTLIQKVTQKSIIPPYEYSEEVKENLFKHNFYIETSVQNYDVADSEMCEDRIFLLDVKQVNTVYKSFDNYYKEAEATSGALINGHETREHKYFSYTLRTPYTCATAWKYLNNVRWIVPNPGDYAGNVRFVDSSIAAGIRPAFFLNESANGIFKMGLGTEVEPYRLS